MNQLSIPDCPDNLQDVPFSFDGSYRDRIGQQLKKDQPSSEMLYADPVLIRIPGAPDSTAHYAPDGTRLPAPQDRPILKDGQTPENGRYYAEIGSAHIEAFLRKGTRDYLYVFLDGARTRNQGRDLAPLPSFLRWSWYQYTSASVLCLEDPMYYTYGGLKLGWFYGTQDENYAEFCAMFVRHIADLLGVPLQHIILYGPSAGGHAAISMSAFIPGCMSVTVNGKYDITLHENYRKGLFSGVTGFSADSPDSLNRNCSAGIIREHPENHYLLICNILSKQDFDEQLQQLCSKLDIVPQYGLKTFGHLTFWLIDAKGAPSTHSVWETPTQFRMIDVLLPNLMNGSKAQDFRQYCEIINHYWKEQFISRSAILEQEKSIRTLSQTVPARFLTLAGRTARKLIAVVRPAKKPEQ